MAYIVRTRSGGFRMRGMPGLLLGLLSAVAVFGAEGPDRWVPARWEGGPLEAAYRAAGEKPPSPEVSDAIVRWYGPATLELLRGTPINCLLLTLGGGTDRKLERRQFRIVNAYARKAREQGLAVLGLVYPGADPRITARAAAEAGLDGVVPDGEFAAAPRFIEQLQNGLRSRNSAARVIPIGSAAAAIRGADWSILAAAGHVPGVGKVADGAIASPTGGLWIDSNLWLVQSLRLAPAPRPVWLSHPTGNGFLRDYQRSIADAAAAGAQWIVTPDDNLRLELLRGNTTARELWRNIANTLAFFRQHAEWRGLAPYGNLGIIFDPAGANLANAEEYLNLVARRRISYQVIRRSRLSAPLLRDLRAVLAFDLAPPSEGERRLLRDFAAQGGLVLAGKSWGDPPQEQDYTVVSVGRGEVAVYKEESPDPQSVARDLNDLLTTPDFGVSLFNAPSVLPAVTTIGSGGRILIQMVNYSDAPAADLMVWVARQCWSAQMYTLGGAPLVLPLKSSASRTEIVIPRFDAYAALLLEYR